MQVRCVQLVVLTAVLGVGVLLTDRVAAERIYTQGEKRLAVSGYDPVAYFRPGAAQQGSLEFEFSWGGATWRFVSADHLERFRADPERYAPQYGGFCAYAVANGYTASSDPEVFKVVGDKLYLNFSRAVGDRWAEDIPGHIRKADENWPKLQGP